MMTIVIGIATIVVDQIMTIVVGIVTIVVGVATIVDDCDYCEHCDNCDHINPSLQPTIFYHSVDDFQLLPGFTEA